MNLAVISFADLKSAVTGALAMSFVVFLIAKFIHFRVSRNSERRRIQGEPACYWTPLWYFLGACYGIGISDNEYVFLNEAPGGCGGFGILIGYAIGMIHGLINLWLADAKPPSTNSPDHLGKETDSTNPYRSPKHPS